MADGSDDLDFINKIKASVGDLLPDQKPAIKEPINAKAMEESLGRLGIKRDDPASAEYFRLLDGMAYAHNNVPNRQEPLGWVHALSGAGSAGMLAWAGDSNPQRYSQQFLDNEFKRRSGLESEGTDFVGKFIGPTAQASLTAKIAQQMEALKKNNLAVSMKVKQGKIYNTYAEMENDQRLHPAGTNPAPAGIQRKPAVPVAPKIPGPQQPSMTPSAPSSGLPGTSLDMGGIPQPMPGQPPQAMTPSPTPPAAPPAAVGAPSIAPVAGPGAAPRIGVTTKYDNSVLPPFTVPYSDEDLANAAVYGDDKIADNMRQQNDQARKNYEIEMKKAEQMRLSKEANPEEKASLAEAQKIGEARGEAKVALPKAHEDTLAFLVNSEKLLADKNLGRVTGAVNGRWPKQAQGEKAAETQSRVDQLQGEVFLNAFNSIRGAGAITEAEGAQAKAAIGRLGTQTMGTPGYKQAVKDVQNALINMYNVARQKAGQPPVDLQAMMQEIDISQPSGRRQPGQGGQPGQAAGQQGAQGDQGRAAAPQLAVPPQEFLSGVRQDYASADEAGKQAIMASLKKRGIDPAQVLGEAARPQHPPIPSAVIEGPEALERQVQGQQGRIPEGATMMRNGMKMVFSGGKWGPAR